MKKRYLLPCILLAAVASARAGVTIQLDAGVLRTSTGSTFTGGLLQLVAERTSTGAFSAPSPTSFVGGDTANEVVLANFAFNQGGTGFVVGESSNVITFSYESTVAGNSSTTFDPGDLLLLRWYPTLNTASTAPGLGTTYGQYRSSTPPNGGIAWAGPADGTTLTIPNGLNFLTTTAGGSNSDLTGYASNVVGVPEPTSGILLGSALVALSGLAKFRRKA